LSRFRDDDPSSLSEVELDVLEGVGVFIDPIIEGNSSSPPKSLGLLFDGPPDELEGRYLLFEAFEDEFDKNLLEPPEPPEPPLLPDEVLFLPPNREEKINRTLW